MWGGVNDAERESVFEDSDRFEEESLDSGMSDHDASLVNWRGWRQPQSASIDQPLTNDFSAPVPVTTSWSGVQAHHRSGFDVSSASSVPDLTDQRTSQCKDKAGKESSGGNVVLSLKELSTKFVAEIFPFEIVEKHKEPIPADLQLRISFWSFPKQVADIRLYSCLSNGNSEEFTRGETICMSGGVTNMLQIGFHLSGTVSVPTQDNSKPDQYPVSVTFDRNRVTHTCCSCPAEVSWCRHVIALCVSRILNPDRAEIRAPVSESLSHLGRDELRKFAQYLISEMPTQILPTAQRLLDQLNANDGSAINTVLGAPDPTSGPSITDIAMWNMDESKLHAKLKKTLTKFIQVTPAVISDFASVYPQSAPPASSEFNTLLRPIRGKEPEAMWNLLAIVRELLRRRDPNSLLLLDIITQECVNIDALVIWWFTSRTSAHYFSVGSGGGAGGGNQAGQSRQNKTNTTTVAGQQSCASLMDEVVSLWRLVVLNPRLNKLEMDQLLEMMRLYHVFCVNKIRASKGICLQYKRNELASFQGFKPVIRAGLTELPPYPPHVIPVRCAPAGTFLYSYPKSNQTLENARLVHTRMQEEAAAAAAAAVMFNKGENPMANPDDDDEDAIDVQMRRHNNFDRDSRNNLDERAESSMRMPAGTSGSFPIMHFGSLEESESTSVGEDLQNAGRPPVVRRHSLFDMFSDILPDTDKIEVLFMQAESGYAHNFTDYATLVAVELAQVLLSDPPDLLSDPPPCTKFRRRLRYNLSARACQTLQKIVFVCEILSGNALYRGLAFQLGVSGLEMARLPSPSKLLEVKMHHLECVILNNLRSLPIGGEEISLLREKATYLAVNVHYRGQYLLPIYLAQLIFECLDGNSGGSGHEMSDQMLGFKAALAVLAMKSKIAEADNPLLCESIRRGRTELTLMLLIRFKDASDRIRMIVDALLDKGRVEPPLSLQANRLPGKRLDNFAYNERSEHKRSRTFSVDPFNANNDEDCIDAGVESSGSRSDSPFRIDDASQVTQARNAGQCSSRAAGASAAATRFTRQRSMSSESGGDNLSCDSGAGVAPPPVEGSPQMMRSRRRVSTGGESGDHGQDADDQLLDVRTLALSSAEQAAPGPAISNSKLNHSFARRWYKGKKCYTNVPTVPNQPSEALAHFLMELAKQVLVKAGVTSAHYNVFPQVNLEGGNQGLHKGLHMAAFEIGLHALGVLNCVSPNWLSRTYSTYESWIQTQSIEIGSAAINMLTEKWVGHLTPSEAAGIAQRASKVYEMSVRRSAANLALSVLCHANALNVTEITSAIEQCQEQGDELLEKACRNIERAHEMSLNTGGICPEILFRVARSYQKLHDSHYEVARGSEAGAAVTAAQAGVPIRGINPVGHFNATGGASHRLGVPNEETQFQVSCDYMQQEVQSYLMQQFLLTQHAMNLVGPHARPAQFSYPTPAALAQAAGLQSARAAVRAVGLPATPQNIILPGGSRLAATAPVLQQLPNVATSKFSKKAFLNGIEALKTIIRRHHDNRQEFVFRKNYEIEYQDDLKWLLQLTVQLGKQDNQKLLLECLSSGYGNPFVLHELTDLAQGILSRLHGLDYRHHFLFTQLASICWNRYLECISRKLDILGSPSGLGEDDLINTIDSARRSAMTHYAPHHLMQKITELSRVVANSKAELAVQQKLRQHLCNPAPTAAGAPGGGAVTNPS